MGLNMDAAEEDYRDAQILHATIGVMNNLDPKDLDSDLSSLDSLDNEMFGPGEKPEKRGDGDDDDSIGSNDSTEEK